MTTTHSPVARGPLVDLHRQAGAEFVEVGGWQVAARFPHEPEAGGNALVDLSHWPTHEINGPATDAVLADVCGQSVPLRGILSKDGCHIYRLTTARAIFFGNWEKPVPRDTLDVTGGWASLALIGPDAEAILNKVTAVDLRERTLPRQACCQGPIFGMITLFGRFTNRFELHVGSDAAEFLWEVLMDAGSEFGLRPAGETFYQYQKIEQEKTEGTEKKVEL